MKRGSSLFPFFWGIFVGWRAAVARQHCQGAALKASSPWSSLFVLAFQSSVTQKRQRNDRDKGAKHPRGS